MRDRMLAFEKYDFSIGLEVLFPQGTVESNWVARNVRWDGNGPLRVTGATIVWKREERSSDYRRKERFDPKPEADAVYSPPSEHVELLGATQRIETAVS